MAEKFNWKGLFINDEQAAIKQQEPQSFPQQSVENKFPESKSSENKFPEETAQSFTTITTQNPFLEEVLNVYERGFDSLNVQGFDFFELYRSVMAVGATNAQSYQMAFTMGKTINSALTKELLIEKGKFYIAEIEKVYNKFDADGNTKKANLDANIANQKQSLSNTIKDLEQQISNLKNELEKKKAELLKVDSANREQHSQIQLKIEANNLAKNRIVESINTVLTGINQYL